MGKVEYFITTAKTKVEEERNRLIALGETDKVWWNSEFRSGWARKQFGETLKENDGFTHPIGTENKPCECKICGVNPDREEKVIELQFSLCDEYDCGMMVCKTCISKLFKLLD